MAKGYTTADLVQQELGRSLTAEQLTQVGGLVEEAEAYVDRVTGKSWLVASPATSELHALVGPYVYLRRTPVASVSAVTIRSSAIGATETTLVAGSGYELLDPATGLLSLSAYPLADPVVNGPAYSPGTLVKVTYTYTDPLPVPADVRGVVTRMVANRMRGRVDPSMSGVKSVSVGQGDLAVTYGDDYLGAGPGASEADLAILRSYRGVVFA